MKSDPSVANMLSDTEASLAIALAVCLKKEKKRRRMKEWLEKRNGYTHENLLKDLRLSEPSAFQNFLRLDATSFDELLKTITPQTEKGILLREMLFLQLLSITLRYLATGNTFEDLKFTSAVSPQSTGIIVMETCKALIHTNHLIIISIRKSLSIYLRSRYSYFFFYCVAVILALDIPQSR